ncbi:pilus assembly protein PilN [Asaia spathodeae]|uniref:Pilus assembly protein PilN n=1 Tax=Asaia spathodeae TaxID=657016 RepID=A0ABX2P8E8_9PROT|nr:pilus assembly protein PilN [Asaia spathodeae]GBR16833.1 Tfp pilus assembly protein PilN [Asaia spathodeae NBRC 105894]
MKRLPLVITGLVSLSACGDFQDVTKMQKENEQAINEAKLPDAPVAEHISRPWLLGDLLPPQAEVPALLRAPVNMFSARPIGLRDAALMASAESGIPVSLDDDLDSTTLASSSQGFGQRNPVQFNGTSLPPPPTVSSFAQPSPTANAAGRQKGIGPWFSYQGDKAGLFAALATRFGVYQKYEAGGIRFYRTETRTFVIPAFGGKPAETSSGITAMTGPGQSAGSGGMGMGMGMGGMSGSSSNGGSAGAASGSMSFSTSASYDAWKNIQATAEMISGGAQIVADSSLGRLSATGTPRQLDRLDEWVRSIQADMMKQVSLVLTIYQVKLTHEQNLGWQPKVGFETAAKAWGFQTTPLSLLQPQGSSSPLNLGGSILDTAGGTAGQFKGTSFVMQSLAQIGVVTDRSQRTAVTLNNHPAPFNVTTNTTYVCGTNTVLATNAGSSSSIQQCTTSAGITGDITPRVVDNRILLHVSLHLATLLGLKDVNQNGGYVQQPQTASAVFDSEAGLESGNTLVISGYMANQGQKTKNGVGVADNFLLGGAGDAQTQKQMIFLTVTARTL